MQTRLDQDRISELLGKLTPRQEKVVRLYFGLGCQRPHSAQEMAEEFGVSPRVIAGLLESANRKLAQEGLTSCELHEAAGHQADYRKRSVGQRLCRSRMLDPRAARSDTRGDP